MTSLKLFAAVLLGGMIASTAAYGAAPHSPAPKQAPAAIATDTDQTLHAMQDEMDRSKARLAIPHVGKPFFTE